MSEYRLPIKIISPQKDDYSQDWVSGGRSKNFGNVTEELRFDLANQVDLISQYFDFAFNKDSVPAVAKVTLKTEALAKSHRPTNLFQDGTCPIIGGNKFGELYISVTPSRLNELKIKIENNKSEKTIANLSTIVSLEPYTHQDALGEFNLNHIKSIIEDGSPLKLRLFQHNEKSIDKQLEERLHTKVKILNAQLSKRMPYGQDSTIYSIEIEDLNTLREIVRFVGTQSIGPFPQYSLVKNQAVSIRRASKKDLPPPDPDEDYPIVGLIDSGVNPNDPILAPWVAQREYYVPEVFRDYSHGSFVAGLIAAGHTLNHSDPRFPTTSAKVLDVVALPEKNSSINEMELLILLEDVIPKYPQIRVWNLSLGLNGSPCQNDSISDLAAALDRMQDDYNVTFVIAAGNYTALPLRKWPSDIKDDADRVCSPADSVRGLVVASLAHKHSANSCVKSEEPSPFSRRGPGVAYLPKPEISHYGGNCSLSGDFSQTGVLSIDESNCLAEDIGTSFSTPIVSSVLANVHHSFQTPPSRILCKALAIHSAVLGDTEIDGEELKYRGYGTIRNLEDILTCTQSSATLIFEPHIRPGTSFVKDYFPIPPSLRNSNGKVCAEFVMTLVYDPPLDKNFGSEYCRQNIWASFGTFDNGYDGKPRHKKQVYELPKKQGLYNEQHLIEHGFKWSPLKVYRRTTSGVSGDRWRLVIKGQNRSGYLPQMSTPVALILTIRDPNENSTKPVYNELIAEMNKATWQIQDIPITGRIKNRVSL